MNLEKIGPGYWDFIHRSAIKGKNVIYEVLDIFPCESCRNHALNWMEKNSQRYSEEEIFSMTCDLHNYVNIRIGKRIIGNGELKTYYLGLCKNC